MGRHYLDTSIWLDFFERRDEPNLPKGNWAHQLLNKIVAEDSRIIVSNLVMVELGSAGYSPSEIDRVFQPLKPLLLFVEATAKEIGKAKDLSAKRNIPKGDALHALIARDQRAVMVTLDKHFQELRDIVEVKRPQDLIWSLLPEQQTPLLEFDAALRPLFFF